MKIAYIVPALVNKGPVIVVKELVTEFVKNGHTCIVFYFDEEIQVDFNCPTLRIKKNDFIDFTIYDVVHSHGLRPDKYIFKNRLNANTDTLFVTTMHNYVLQDLRYQYNWVVSFVFGHLWMYLLKKHDKVVTLSQDAQKYYLRWFSIDKLSFAYNTRKVNFERRLSKAEEAELIDFKGDSILIGINALLTARKGIDLMINAMADLPQYKLFIVGEGQSRCKLEKLAAKCGVSDKCYFVGYKPDAYRYLEYYDIFAMPSRSEGFPLSLLEASIYSVPTVASDIAITQEAFSPEEISFFKLSNPITIIDAVKSATNNKQLGLRLHEKYISSYSPEIMYQRYLEIYNQVS